MSKSCWNINMPSFSKVFNECWIDLKLSQDLNIMHLDLPFDGSKPGQPWEAMHSIRGLLRDYKRSWKKWKYAASRSQRGAQRPTYSSKQIFSLQTKELLLEQINWLQVKYSTEGLEFKSLLLHILISICKRWKASIQQSEKVQSLIEQTAISKSW